MRFPPASEWIADPQANTSEHSFTSSCSLAIRHCFGGYSDTKTYFSLVVQSLATAVFLINWLSEYQTENKEVALNNALEVSKVIIFSETQHAVYPTSFINEL